jgi:hypothetical protein
LKAPRSGGGVVHLDSILAGLPVATLRQNNTAAAHGRDWRVLVIKPGNASRSTSVTCRKRGNALLVLARWLIDSKHPRVGV